MSWENPQVSNFNAKSLACLKKHYIEHGEWEQLSFPPVKALTLSEFFFFSKKCFKFKIYILRRFTSQKDSLLFHSLALQLSNCENSSFSWLEKFLRMKERSYKKEKKVCKKIDILFGLYIMMVILFFYRKNHAKYF